MLRGEWLRAQKACVSGVERKGERVLEEKEIDPFPFPSLRKQPTFCDANSGFPSKWRLTNERRNSILRTRHYPDLGSASDWLKQISHPTNTRPIKRTTHIWVSDSSSVLNFCARLSDVISPGNHWWRHKMSTILSGYSFSFRVFFPLLSSFLHQLPRLGIKLAFTFHG